MYTETHTHQQGNNPEKKHNKDFCSITPALVLRMRGKLLRSGAVYHPLAFTATPNASSTPWMLTNYASLTRSGTDPQ